MENQTGEKRNPQVIRVVSGVLVFNIAINKITRKLKELPPEEEISTQILQEMKEVIEILISDVTEFTPMQEKEISEMMVEMLIKALEEKSN